MAKYSFKPIFPYALNEAVKSLENAKYNMGTNISRIEGIKVQPSKVLYACRGFDITAEVELNGRQFSCVHIYELNEGATSPSKSRAYHTKTRAGNGRPNTLTRAPSSR